MKRLRYAVALMVAFTIILPVALLYAVHATVAWLVFDRTRWSRYLLDKAERIERWGMR